VVLAEVCRGSRLDAAVNQLLAREAIRVANLTRQIAQRTALQHTYKLGGRQ
jgi:hypothetical protein